MKHMWLNVLGSKGVVSGWSFRAVQESGFFDSFVSLLFKDTK